MKLMRWGAKGAEKPGLVDRAGVRRDLSEHVREITPDILSPEGLKSLAGIDAPPCQWSLRRRGPACR